MTFKWFKYVCINFVWVLICIYFSYFVLFLIKINDWHSLFNKCRESLLEYLYIIIISCSSSSCFCAWLNPINHSLFVTIKEKYEDHICILPHNALPSILIILVSWESINEEVLLVPTVLLHCFFNKRDCNIDRNNLSLHNNIINQLTVRAATISLHSSQ